MKKKTYRIIECIPVFGKLYLFLSGNHKIMMCSPGLSEGIYDPILAYMREHPDEVVTDKMAKEIWQKAKQKK